MRLESAKVLCDRSLRSDTTLSIQQFIHARSLHDTGTPIACMHWHSVRKCSGAMNHEHTQLIRHIHFRSCIFHAIFVQGMHTLILNSLRVKISHGYPETYAGDFHYEIWRSVRGAWLRKTKNPTIELDW